MDGPLYLFIYIQLLNHMRVFKSSKASLLCYIRSPGLFRNVHVGRPIFIAKYILK